MTRSFSPAAAASSAAQGHRGPGRPRSADRGTRRRPPVTHLELQPVDHRRVVLHAAAARTPQDGPQSRRAPDSAPIHSLRPGGAAPGLFVAHPASVGLTSGVFPTRHRYVPRWRPMAAAFGWCACPLGPPPSPRRGGLAGRGWGWAGSRRGFLGGADGAPPGAAPPGTALSPPHTRSPSRPLRVSCWDPSLPIIPELPT